MCSRTRENNKNKVKSDFWDTLYYVLVLNCPEKDVSCLPSCGAEGSSLGNVTSQLQCASKSAGGFYIFSVFFCQFGLMDSFFGISTHDHDSDLKHS